MVKKKDEQKERSKSELNREKEVTVKLVSNVPAVKLIVVKIGTKCKSNEGISDSDQTEECTSTGSILDDKSIIPEMQKTRKKGSSLILEGKGLDLSCDITTRPHSLLAKIVGPDGMTPIYGNQYFIDRDPAHFRFILNFLRNGACDLRTLPHDVRCLYEMYYEACYYRLPGLVNATIAKIEECSVVGANVMPMKAYKLGR
ncbi:uncharacterized protein LOC128547793 [Mercenaria mercenaria]|uniref:uncharacterized protein LOC128547793 n=1 Tax=Mercenaria mercenaria TaxID=6596 RepID=UPI00234E71E8|nr:uncharacterized protein LOC128547793 [Mercenaria mercenaria]